MKVSKKLLNGIAIAVGISTLTASCTISKIVSDKIKAKIEKNDPNFDNCPACGKG
jgi:hypothetical protein